MHTRARDNPFTCERVESLLSFEPEWLGHTWQGLMERLKKLEYRAAVVGPHGSGKTTLLAGLKTRIEQQGFQVIALFLNDAQTKLSEADWIRLAGAGAGAGKGGDESDAEKVIVFLDGAEQMSWRDWRRLRICTRHLRGLLITQHKPAKLPLLVATETNIEMLREFVGRLDPGFDSGDEIVERIYLDSNGNVREALWQCYDRVAMGLCS